MPATLADKKTEGTATLTVLMVKLAKTSLKICCGKFAPIDQDISTDL